MDRRKKYLLMSPHPDDIAFSMGGMILKNNKEIEFIICDVFTEKKYNILNMTEDEAGGIIMQEEEKAVNKMQVNNMMLGYREAYTRKSCRLSDVFGKKVSKGQIAQETVYRQVKQSICKSIDKICPDIVFAPLGCGWHRDHLIVKQSVEECYKNGHDFNLYFYEDMPYSANASWLSEALYDAALHYLLEEMIIKIDDVLDDKDELLKIYKTQIKSRDIRLMHAYMESIQNNSICERFWKVKRERRK